MSYLAGATALRRKPFHGLCQTVSEFTCVQTAQKGQMKMLISISAPGSNARA